LGDDVGRVIVSGFDAERSGPDILVLRAKSPAEKLWRLQGPASGLEKSDGVAVVAVPQPAGPAAIAVAGRDGHVYLLDGRTGAQIADHVISPTPLPFPPQLVVTEHEGDASLAVFYSQAGASPDDPKPLHGALLALSGQRILWQQNYGSSWDGATLGLRLSGSPHVVLWNSSRWQAIDLSTGEMRIAGALPGRLFGGPAIIELAAGEGPALVFQFTDPAQDMLAVRASDATVLWRGPNNLSPVRQPRVGNSVPRTPGGFLLVNR
jgi:hypothetical protein